MSLLLRSQIWTPQDSGVLNVIITITWLVMEAARVHRAPRRMPDEERRGLGDRQKEMPVYGRAVWWKPRESEFQEGGRQ